MIHRVVFGSIERFIGILIEHFAGAFPTWLAPVQAMIIPITDRQHEYAKELEKKLNAAGIRVEADYRSEKMGYKIREAQLKKIPYMLVVGDKEVESATVSVRARKGVDLGAMSLNDLTARMKDEIARKENGLEQA